VIFSRSGKRVFLTQEIFMFAPTELRGLPTSSTQTLAPRNKKQARTFQPIERLENRQLMSASVAGVVYNDLNVANALKPGDPMIAGVRVYADLGNHNAYKAGDPTAITNSVGAYKIGNLAPGSYVLREVVPSHFRQTEPTNDAGHNIVIASDFTHLNNVNFGNTQKVRVSGYVFNDSNGERRDRRDTEAAERKMKFGFFPGKEGSA
jgi:hypothetical protein